MLFCGVGMTIGCGWAIREIRARYQEIELQKMKARDARES